MTTCNDAAAVQRRRRAAMRIGEAEPLIRCTTCGEGAWVHERDGVTGYVVAITVVCNTCLFAITFGPGGRVLAIVGGGK